LDTIGNISFWNVATGKFVNTLSDPQGKGHYRHRVQPER
jgi:hypothetical protein